MNLLSTTEQKESGERKCLGGIFRDREEKNSIKRERVWGKEENLWCCPLQLQPTALITNLVLRESERLIVERRKFYKENVWGKGRKCFGLIYV